MTASVVGARVDWTRLRRHVVRVERADGSGLLGTGFFVAPGWVLTAAHVVYDTRLGAELDRVDVWPADPQVGAAAVPADVVARSGPPDGTRTWPFPDLALLRLAADLDHPCVLLDAAVPADGCHAFGFPPREYGVASPGSPATFRFEGV